MEEKIRVVCKDSVYINQNKQVYLNKRVISCGRVYTDNSEYVGIVEFRLDSVEVNEGSRAYLYLNLNSIISMEGRNYLININPIVNVKNINRIEWSNYPIKIGGDGVNCEISNDEKGKYIGVDITKLLEKYNEKNGIVLLIRVIKSDFSAVINFESHRGSKPPILMIVNDKSDGDGEEYSKVNMEDNVENNYKYDDVNNRRRSQSQNSNNPLVEHIIKELEKVNNKVDKALLEIDKLGEQIDFIAEKVENIDSLDGSIEKLNKALEIISRVLEDVSIEKI